MKKRLGYRLDVHLASSIARCLARCLDTRVNIRLDGRLNNDKAAEFRGVAALIILGIYMGTTLLPVSAEAQEPVSATERAADGEPPERDVNNPDEAETADQETAFEDYEASEQISEDLSVSFPVDI